MTTRKLHDMTTVTISEDGKRAMVHKVTAEIRPSRTGGGMMGMLSVQLGPVLEESAPAASAPAAPNRLTGKRW